MFNIFEWFSKFIARKDLNVSAFGLKGKCNIRLTSSETGEYLIVRDGKYTAETKIVNGQRVEDVTVVECGVKTGGKIESCFLSCRVALINPTTVLIELDSETLPDGRTSFRRLVISNQGKTFRLQYRVRFFVDGKKINNTHIYSARNYAKDKLNPSDLDNGGLLTLVDPPTAGDHPASAGYMPLPVDQTAAKIGDYVSQESIPLPQ